MKRMIERKLKSTRGSGIAEALVGFLISVLSVMTLLGVASTTLELIKQGDLSLSRLYLEEGTAETFVKSGYNEVNDPDLIWVGGTYSSLGQSTSHYKLQVTGDDLLDESGQAQAFAEADVEYGITTHHHLFCFHASVSSNP